MMRVMVRGVIYESVAECAKALGVKKIAVYSSMSRGRLDTLGLGRGRVMGENTRAKIRGKPVKIGNREWPSMAALSRWLGMEKQYVATAKREGRYEHVIGRAMRKMEQERRTK